MVEVAFSSSLLERDSVNKSVGVLVSSFKVRSAVGRSNIPSVMQTEAAATSSALKKHTELCPAQERV